MGILKTIDRIPMWKLVVVLFLCVAYLPEAIEEAKIKYVVITIDGIEMRTVEEVADDKMQTGIYYIKNSRDLEFKEVVLAQLLHETDSLRSAISRECRNDFGMKPNSRRIYTHKCRGHAGYASHYDSFIDYYMWQTKYLPSYERRYKRKVRTNEDYIDFLYAQQYAEDKQYRAKILYWIPKAKELLRTYRVRDLKTDEVPIPSS